MADGVALEPRIGLFWGIPREAQTLRLVGLSRPASQVVVVAGFKTLDEGHVDIWPTVVRRWPELQTYQYEYFPRGRVNWREEDEVFLLLLDRKLMTDTFLGLLTSRWSLPVARTLITSDPHYRSSWRKRND